VRVAEVELDDCWIDTCVKAESADSTSLPITLMMTMATSVAFEAPVYVKAMRSVPVKLGFAMYDNLPELSNV
jgi:hypothetical protein